MNTRLNSLRTLWTSVVQQIENELISAGLILTALPYAGYRYARMKDQIFVVQEHHIVNLSEEAEAMAFLESIEFLAPDCRLTALVWSKARDRLMSLVPDMRDLLKKCGVTGDEWAAECQTVGEMKDLIRSLWSAFGPDFFQLIPNERENYRDAIPEFVNTHRG